MNKELKELWGDQVDCLVKRLNEYEEGALKPCQLCRYARQIAQATFVCGDCLLCNKEGDCTSGRAARRMVKRIELRLPIRMGADKRMIKNWYDLMIKRANERLEEEGLPWQIKGGKFKW